MFEGELTGIILGLHLICTLPWSLTTVLIALDNQAAIMALSNNARQPSQYLLDEIHEHIHALKRTHRHLHIHFEWVPGHSGIPGNEQADELARAATTSATASRPGPPDHLPKLLRKPLPFSITALKAARTKSITPDWGKLWQLSPCTQ